VVAPHGGVGVVGEVRLGVAQRKRPQEPVAVGKVTVGVLEAIACHRRQLRLPQILQLVVLVKEGGN
jgi:hypothetical protein